MKLKEDPKLIARGAIAFLKSYPCAICKYEIRDTHHSRCMYGFTRHGRCPVYKILKKEFEKLEADTLYGKVCQTIYTEDL